MRQAYEAQREAWRSALHKGRVDPLILSVPEAPLPDENAPWGQDLALYREVDRFCLPVPLDFTGRECFKVLRPTRGFK